MLVWIIDSDWSIVYWIIRSIEKWVIYIQDNQWNLHATKDQKRIFNPLNK